jgi:lipopolysaccharide export system protein LptA
MQSTRSHLTRTSILLFLCLAGSNLPLMALESDRQEPLEVNADSTDGTLGDGITTLRGNVEISQGTLLITADEAEVSKLDGRVNSVIFRGQPALLKQEIEEQGLVHATSNLIEYQVASGLVTLQGNADVKHPQYEISGELLTYDLNLQHFRGNSDGSGNGRIHIRLDPEVIDGSTQKKEQKEVDGVDEPQIEDPRDNN